MKKLALLLLILPFMIACSDDKDKKLNIWSDKNPIEPYRWRKGDR